MVINMQENIRRIKEKYTPQLLKLKGVVGVGIGSKVVEGRATDELTIVVLVDKKLPEHDQIIPKSLEGIPTDVQEAGVIKALKTDQDR